MAEMSSIPDFRFVPEEPLPLLAPVVFPDGAVIQTKSADLDGDKRADRVTVETDGVNLSVYIQIALPEVDIIQKEEIDSTYGVGAHRFAESGKAYSEVRKIYPPKEVTGTGPIVITEFRIVDEEKDGDLDIHIRFARQIKTDGGTAIVPGAFFLINEKTRPNVPLLEMVPRRDGGRGKG